MEHQEIWDSITALKGVAQAQTLRIERLDELALETAKNLHDTVHLVAEQSEQLKIITKWISDLQEFREEQEAKEGAQDQEIAALALAGDYTKVVTDNQLARIKELERFREAQQTRIEALELLEPMVKYPEFMAEFRKQAATDKKTPDQLDTGNVERPL